MFLSDCLAGVCLHGCVNAYTRCLQQSTSNIWGNTNPRPTHTKHLQTHKLIPQIALRLLSWQTCSLLTMRGSHFAPWSMNQIYDVHYVCYYSAHAGWAVKQLYEAPDEASMPRTHTHLQKPLFLWAPVPGFQDRMQSINIHSQAEPKTRRERESLCERLRGRSRGPAKALFVVILAHELGFSHTHTARLPPLNPSIQNKIII